MKNTKTDLDEVKEIRRKRYLKRSIERNKEYNERVNGRSIS